MDSTSTATSISTTAVKVNVNVKKKIITIVRLRLIDALRRAQRMSSETRGVKVAASKEGVDVDRTMRPR